MTTTEILQSARERFQKSQKNYASDEKLLSDFDKELRIALKSFADEVKEKINIEKKQEESLEGFGAFNVCLSIIQEELNQI